MNNSDSRIRHAHAHAHAHAHDDGDRSALQSVVGGPYSGASTAGSALKHETPDNYRPEFTLLVAGCRGGKTSFLRLLLDTSVVSLRTTKDQLASVAKFVQGCSGHTAYIRAASIDINLDVDGIGTGHQPLGLTLIDTPSLDFRDDVSAERLLNDVIRHIDSRFAEGLEDDWKAKTGDRYVHLCIYFLDPDQIIPPSVPVPPAPLIPRTRNNSFSQPDHEPVILEPPLPNNPLLARPTLPQADIAAIRRLSGRVNVLPVIARADTLSNERLAAVKMAIRRDLAEAGIGFGIFDTDAPPYNSGGGGAVTSTAASGGAVSASAVDERTPVSGSGNRPDSSNGYGGHSAAGMGMGMGMGGGGGGSGGGGSSGVGGVGVGAGGGVAGNSGSAGGGASAGPNGSSATNNSPPTSPTSQPILRLPYALISPDMYSHSDGVSRRAPSRHELVQQYTPTTTTTHHHYPFPRGKFVRSYRWGTLDVLDPSHSDFISLRTAIFHHMETLQCYTRDYLFVKFRADYTHQRPNSRHSISQSQSHSHLPSHIPTMQQQHNSRPILAIDTAPPSHPPSSLAHRHSMAVQQQQQQQQQHSHSQPPQQQQQQQRHDMYAGDVRSAPPPRASMPSDPTPVSGTSRAGLANRVKPRSKKITVACNFCRSRKLKCDGGRPTCGQCLKRSNPCDYMPQNKRRGTQRQRKGDESGSESGDERSAEAEEPSLSPDIPSQPPSRRSSNVGRHQQQQHEGYPHSLPSMSALSDRDRERRDDSSAASSSRLKVESASSASMVGSSGGGLVGGGSSSSANRGGGGPMRNYFRHDHDVPPIATLPMTDHSPPTPAPMSAPTLPPIRPASDLQAAQRKRAATVPGKTHRQSTSSGPKVVACNFCRARKTKCDGAHPACASCARRQLDCNYVHDGGASNGGSGQKKARRSSTSKAQNTDSPRSVSPPSSRMIPTPSTAGHDGGGGHDIREVEMHLGDEVDLKRPQLEHGDISRAPKKMRMDDNHSPAHAHAGMLP